MEADRVAVVQQRLARRRADDGECGDDAHLRDIAVGRDECGWFRSALAERTPRTAGPGDPGDRNLAMQLGDRIPIVVDSSKWSVLEAGLKCLQGKGVVNSLDR